MAKYKAYVIFVHGCNTLTLYHVQDNYHYHITQHLPINKNQGYNLRSFLVEKGTTHIPNY